MASDWMLRRVQGAGTTPQAPSPVPQTPQPAPQIPQAPVVSQVPQGHTPQASTGWETPQGKFFSGNLIQKAFDIPQLPAYAISGFQKGAYGEKANQIQSGAVDTQSYGQNIFNRIKAGIKGIIPGIQNRTMPGTEQGNVNLGKEVGIKGNTGQAAYDFAVSMAQPNLPVAKIPGVKQAANFVGKGVNKGAEILRGIEPVAKGLEKLSVLPFIGDKLEYFRNPEVGKILTQGNEKASLRVSGLFNKINDLAQGLKPDQLEEVGRLIENQGTSTDPKLISIATEMKGISDKVGQELVDLGVMKPETFAKYEGGYLSHIADIVKNTESSGARGGVLKFATNSLKERKDKLPDYIRQFQFPTFKALGGEMQTAESVKSLKDIASKFGKTGSEFMDTLGGPRKTQEGMVALSDVLPPKIGPLFHGVSVPPEVADYVTRKYAKTDPNLLQRIGEKALGYWKAGKTIVNPAYHVRNVLSNLILSDMSTGEGLARTVASYGDAVKAYMGKGSPEMMQYLQEMKDAGVIGRTTLSKGVEEFNPKTFQKGKSVIGKVMDAPFKFQNANEETSKLNVYSYWRSHGADIKEAAQKAQEAIFSPYNINPNEKGLVKGIIPFYSFTRQALPFTAKTLAENPSRLTKYSKLKTGVESLSPNDTKQNENLPDSLKGAVRTPIKDKYGQSVYADPTYIYPFGNFQEAGFSKGQLPFGLGLNPLLTEAVSSGLGGLLGEGFNKDLYFNQPIAKSNIPEKRKAQLQAHAVRTFAPTVVSTGQQFYSALKGLPDYAGRTRGKLGAVLNATGFKNASYNPQDQQKFDQINKNKQLQSINSEIKSTMLDKRIPASEKTTLIKRLQEIRRSLILGK